MDSHEFIGRVKSYVTSAGSLDGNNDINLMIYAARVYVHLERMKTTDSLDLRIADAFGQAYIEATNLARGEVDAWDGEIFID